ncbi:MAG: CPXCG motif-containing cysteine-rich protein [Gammaproteobacteria bacterium]|mgnify:CR=1 FL=1|jgi:hypothetical protein|nr:CPXCG motif-containing cysteine-rich protein [Gammaproteobacteria bacterium]
MNLDSAINSCPYCGESIEFFIEPLEEVQEYFEDCTVCCQPIQILVIPNIETGTPDVRFLCANDTF